MRGKKLKTQEKTQNSRKKLKVWEDFSTPEVPSGVIKKPELPRETFRFSKYLKLFFQDL